MKNLVLSSILILLISSCSVSQFKSFQRTTEPILEYSDIVPWFQKDTDHFLFHTNIDIYKNHFGGILVIKSLTPDSYRVVYITELGIKIFDMEFFRNDDFKLHYCLDEINRNSVIKTLKTDIGLMVDIIPENNNLKIWQDNQNGKTLIRSKNRIGIIYFTTKDKTKRVEEILLRNRLRKKMNILFYSKNGIELDSVMISHYNMKLNIHLSKLNETRPNVP